MDIVPLGRARELAEAAGLDLVVVSEKSDPPVVRIMDFGKLQYEQKKNLKAQRKNTAVQKLKEVKFHMNIGSNDYAYKLKHAIDFLQKGCRLKATLVLRGREMAHKDMADELIDRIVSELSAYGEADGKPKLLGRNITVTFAPLKSTKKNPKAVRVEVAEVADDSAAEEVEAAEEE